MRMVLVGAARTGIGEVSETVIGNTPIPILRVLHTQQVGLGEAVIDLDIELVVFTEGGPAGDPVVVDPAVIARVPGYSAWGTTASSSGRQDRSDCPDRPVTDTAFHSGWDFRGWHIEQHY